MELVDYMVHLGDSEQPASRSLFCLLASEGCSGWRGTGWALGPMACRPVAHLFVQLVQVVLVPPRAVNARVDQTLIFL